MPIGYSRPGPDNVSEYRMSGIPYLTASTLQRGDVIQVNLPYVSKFIKITNNETQSGTKIAFGVSASAHTLGNEFINVASGQTETFNIATKVFFLSNSAGNTTNGSLQFQACAGLTFIDEYPLWGDGIGTLVVAPVSFANAYSADFGGGSTNVYITGSDMSGTLNGTRRATFSSWIKSDGTWGASTNDVVCSRARNKAVASDNQFFFRIGTGGSNHHAQLSLGITSATTADAAIHSASLFTANVWHHILWVYDGDQATNATRVRGWVDGAERTLNYTGTIPATIRSSSAQWLFGLAVWTTKSSPFGPGNVDEFAVWTDMALSQSQINEIYNAGDPPNLNSLATTPTPAYWFRMGDDSSDTISQLANINGSERFVVCRPTGSTAIWVQDVP